MKKLLLILFLACSLFLVSPLIAQDAKVTSTMSKPLPDTPGKELLMITQCEQDGTSQVLGVLAQGQGCTCSDSGEVASALKR